MPRLTVPAVILMVVHQVVAEAMVSVVMGLAIDRVVATGDSGADRRRPTVGGSVTRPHRRRHRRADSCGSDDDIHAALRGLSAIIVVHRLSLAARADRVLVLAHGRVIEMGTHDELVSLGGATRDCGRPGRGIDDRGTVTPAGCADLTRRHDFFNMNQECRSPRSEMHLTFKLDFFLKQG
jgi:hypothetical protein